MIVLSVTVVATPVPPAKLMTSPVLTESFEPVSAPILNDDITVANDRLPEPSVCKN